MLENLYSNRRLNLMRYEKPQISKEGELRTEAMPPPVRSGNIISVP
jgi:hypothetical protein